MKEKTVFISYAWGTEEQNNWVLKLADFLIEEGGLEVIFDQYDLVPGRDLNYFMESGIEKADKVIMILTPEYKQKADTRQGGTGFENSIISGNLYEVQNEVNGKFIPILKSGNKKDSAPTYLKTKVYHVMKNPATFEIDAFNLLKIIYGYSDKKKPRKGKIPDFENIDRDPVIKIAQEVSQKQKKNTTLNNLKNSEKGAALAKKEINELFDMISDKCKLYTNKTEFNFHFKINSANNQASINSQKHSVSLTAISNHYNFSGNKTMLHLQFWNGNYIIKESNQLYFQNKKPQLIIENSYEFDFNVYQNPVWRNSGKNEVNKQSISQSIFEYLITAIQKDSARNFRKS